MAKRFKLRFSKVIPSFLLCRSKHPNHHHTNPISSSIIHRPSPLSRKSLDISYPSLPNPPPSTPISLYECGVDSTESNDGDVSSTSPFLAKKRVSKTKSATFNLNAVVRGRISSSSGDSGWFSSDEDQQQQHMPPSRHFSKRKSTTLRAKIDKASTFGSKSGVMESIAIEKRSEDPYSDFKKSMMEMILEKEIVEVRDLEELLRCFLTLNSRQHHQVIVEAFTAIWNALFSQVAAGTQSFRCSESQLRKDNEAQMPEKCS